MRFIINSDGTVTSGPKRRQRKFIIEERTDKAAHEYEYVGSLLAAKRHANKNRKYDKKDSLISVIDVEDEEFKRCVAENYNGRWSTYVELDFYDYDID